jgi:hypothetical protein
MHRQCGECKRSTVIGIRKVTASLQVDGLDVQATLEAAGAGEELPDGLDAALSLGRAVYRALGGGERASLAA